MNVKKAIKRVVALGTGAALMGATVLGAMAADLADFPEPFVKNGNFDAMIVVGQSAASADVIGAVDIATTLQYEMKQQTTTGAGSVTSVTLSGDSFAVQKNSDILTMNEYVGDVEDKLDSTYFSALAGGEFDSEDYSEYLTLPTGSGANVQYMENPDTDEIGTFLTLDNDAEIYTYELELDSSVSTSETDIVDESITVMGKEYTITEASIANDDELKLTLLGGDLTKTLAEGDSATYTLNGVDYTVDVVYIGSDGAKFTVNGYDTDKLDESESDKIDELDISLGVREILAGTKESDIDLVEFYLGADQLVLEDTDVTNDAVGGKHVTIGDETYNNLNVEIQGSTVDSTGAISFEGFTVEATADDDYYVAPGEALSDYIDGTNEDYLFGGVDVRYEGLTEPSGQTIKVDANNEQYYVDFTTVGNVEYKLPYAYTDGVNTVLGGKYHATTPEVLTVTQGGASSYSDSTIDAIHNNGAEYFLAKDQLVMVVDSETNPEDRKARFLEITDVDFDADNAETTVSFDDLAVGGNSYDIVLKNESSTSDLILKGELTIDGEDHTIYQNVSTANSAAGQSTFWMDLAPASATDTPLAVGLPGDVYLIMDDTVAVGNLTLSVGVAADSFDEAISTDQIYTINLTGKDADDVKVAGSFAPIQDSYVTLDDDNYKRAYNLYGMMITENTDTEDVEVFIPSTQVNGQVFFTSGAVTSSTVSAGADGAAYTLSPVGAEIAVLDTEASGWQTENIVVVGGPCVNTVAASLMGTGADCAADFTAGKAMVKLFPQGSKVAMLVAGYSADDTRRATKVVHNYAAYSDDFKGMELEVSGTSMSDISITSMN